MQRFCHFPKWLQSIATSTDATDSSVHPPHHHPGVGMATPHTTQDIQVHIHKQCTAQPTQLHLHQLTHNQAMLPHHLHHQHTRNQAIHNQVTQNQVTHNQVTQVIKDTKIL